MSPFNVDEPTYSPPPPHSDPVVTINRASELMLEDLELSPLTKRTYRHGLRALVRFLHANNGDDDAADALAPYPIGKIDEDTLYRFNRWLREAYPDPRNRSGELSEGTRTTRTYLVAAKRLMNWLDLHALLPKEVSYDRMLRRIDQGRGHRRQGYRQRRVDPQVIRVLTYYKRQELPKKLGARRLAVLRNRALMAFLYDTGVRISEALATRGQCICVSVCVSWSRQGLCDHPEPRLVAREKCREGRGVVWEHVSTFLAPSACTGSTR